MVRILRFILGCAAGEAVLESSVFSGRGFFGGQRQQSGAGPKEEKKTASQAASDPMPSNKTFAPLPKASVDKNANIVFLMIAYESALYNTSLWQPRPSNDWRLTRTRPHVKIEKRQGIPWPRQCAPVVKWI